MTKKQPLLSLAVLALFALISACDVPANNPFDPKTPVDAQAKASIFGTVVLQEEGASVAGMKVSLLDATRKPVRGVDGQLLFAQVEGKGESGDFTLKGLKPGTYSLVFELDPRFAIPFIPEITLVAGEMRSVGVLNFSVAETGSGRIRGRAALIGAAGGTREIGVYRRREGRPAELVKRVSTDANGNFSADQLPPGVYGVTAEAAGFFPDFSLGHELAAPAPNAITLGEVVLEGENELKLYPATAVLIPDLPRQGSRYITNQDSAEIVLIPSVVDAWVTDMRLSADPAFVEDGEELPFEAFRQRAQVKLPDVEGPITIYGQFRAKADDFEFTTDVFETQLVRDVTPPSFVSVDLRGVVESGGELWAVENGATLTVQVQGNDLESGVAGFALYSDSKGQLGALEDLAFQDLTLPLGFARIDHTFQLLEGQGRRRLGLWLRDHAGNVAGPHALEVIVDSEPPAIAGALEVLNAAPGNRLESRQVQLKIPVDSRCAKEAGSKEDSGASEAGGDNPGDNSGDNPGDDGQAGLEETQLEPGLCPVALRYGVAPLPSSGGFEEFALDENESVGLSLSAGNGQVVGFEVHLQDQAGNTAQYFSELYTLSLQGQLAGVVKVDGYPEDAPEHGAILLQLKEQGTSGELVASALSDSEGNYSLQSSADHSLKLPVGHYLLVASRDDLEPFEVQVEVRENQKLTLPTYRLSPARGFIRGRFVRAGDEASSRAHGNIDVSALRGGVVVARTITSDDGSYTFPSPGLPVSSAGATYSIIGSASGHVSRQVDGLEVHRSQTTVVAPSPGNPDEPRPLALDTLQGDFIVCATLLGPCEPTQYSNQDQLRVKLLRSAGITHVRYRAGEGFAQDEDEAELAWESYQEEDPLIVTVAGPGDPDGEIEIFVQTRSEDEAGPVLSASVVRDTQAPTILSFELEAGPNALEGFTAQHSVRAHFSADKGEGEVAPLHSARVAFASSAPAQIPQDAQLCALDLPCQLQLPTNTGNQVEEKRHHAFLFVCDRAGNCTNPPAEASITYDKTPPTPENGLSFGPAASWIHQVEGQHYSRLERVDVELEVGRARTADADPVLNLAGEEIPEVVAYRFSTREDLQGAAWSPLPSLQAGAAVSLRALELAGNDGLHTVYAQFRDAAGNLSPLSPNPHHFQLILDRQPPSVNFKVNAGAQWTKSRRLELEVQSASPDVGPARQMQVSLDGLFEETQTRPLPLTGDDRFLDLPDSDDSYTVHARFVDAAGNQSERSTRVQLDRSPPALLSARCGACKEDPTTGALHTSSRQVLLDVTASDNSGVIAGVFAKVGDGPEIQSPYGAPLTLNLPDDDGAHELTLRVEDPAGNSSARTSLLMVLDRSPPAMSLSINEGAEYTPNASVVLRLIAEDDSLLSGLRLSNTAGFSGPVQSFATQVPWTLASPSEDGSRTVHAEVRDLAGNISTFSSSIILDSHAPSAPSLSVTPLPVGESQALSSPQIVLKVEGSDGTRPFEEVAVRISGDLALSGGNTGWLRAGSGGLSFTEGSFKWSGALSGGDGNKSLSVQLRDPAGNESETTTLRLLLRQKAPAGGSIAISHTPFTSSVESTLSLSAQGATEVKVTGDLASVDGLPANIGVWLPFAAALPLTFSSGDGEKSVQAIFRNEAQQESPTLSASTTLDTTPPTLSLSLQGSTAQGQPSNSLSATRNIQVQLTADDNGSGTEQIRLASTEAALQNTPWSAFASTLPWTLSEGDGSKTIYAQARDRAGNSSAVQETSILLDTTPPSRPAIQVLEPDPLGAGNALSTRSVKLKLQSSDAAGSLSNGKVRLQGDLEGEGGSSDTGWLSAGEGGLSLEGSDFVWEGQLSGGDGTKTLSVQIRDAAGNESAGASVRFELQTSAPNNPSASLSASGFTRFRALSLNASATGASEMQISGDLSAVDGASAQVGAWRKLASTTPLELSSGDGLKAVVVKFRNKAGLTTDPLTLTLTLDTTPPVAMVEIVGPVDRGETSSSLSGSRSVILNLAGSDSGSGVEAMRVAHTEAGLGSAAWVPFAPTLAWTLPQGDGDQFVFVQLRDAVGNESAPKEASTVLDTTRPSSPRFAKHPAMGSAPQLLLELDTQSSDALSAPVRYEWLLPEANDWEEVVLPQNVNLLENQSQTFRLRAIDGAGNISSEDQLSYIHDNVAPPPPTVVTPTLDVAGRTTSVTLTGSESDPHFSGYEICITNNHDPSSCPSSTACTFEASAATFALSLFSEGYTCLMARSVDGANNVSARSGVAILSDTERPIPPEIGPAVTRDSLSVQANEVEVAITQPAYDPPLAYSPSDAWRNVAYLEVGVNGIFTPLCPNSQKDGRWDPCNPEAEGGRCGDPRLVCHDFKDLEEACPSAPEPDPRCEEGGGSGAAGFSSPMASPGGPDCGPPTPPPCKEHRPLAFILPLSSGNSSTLSARAVDFAGNVGDAVSIEVFAEGTRELELTNNASPQGVQLFGTTLAYAQRSRNNELTPQILELNQARDLGGEIDSCEVLPETQVDKLSLGLQGLAYGKWNMNMRYEIWLRQRGEDGKFCTDDDSHVQLHDGTGNYQLKHLKVHDDTLSFVGLATSSGACQDVNIIQAGDDGVLGTGDDLSLTLSTQVQTWTGLSDMVQHADNTFLVNDGGCPNVNVNTYDSGKWSVLHGPTATGSEVFQFTQTQWDFRPVLSPDGRYLVLSEENGVRIRVLERGPDGRFGHPDARSVSRVIPANLSISQIITDGLRIVGSAYDRYSETNYLFTWSPGFDGVYQGESEDGSDDVFSFFAPSSGLRQDLSLSKGLVAYTQHNRVKSINLAQLRWEAVSARFPSLTPLGLSYARQTAISGAYELHIKQPRSERVVDIGEDSIDAQSPLLGWGDEVLYRRTGFDQFYNQNFSIEVRKTSQTQPFHESDASQSLLSAHLNPGYLPLPKHFNEGKAIIFTAVPNGYDYGAAVVEPGAYGLIDGAVVYPPENHMSSHPDNVAYVSQSYATWQKNGDASVWVWQAGPNGVFEQGATGDDIAPAKLMEGPNFQYSYWANEFAHSGDRIAMIEDHLDYIRVVSAGPDGLFNHGVDPHVDIPVPVTGVCADGVSCNLRLAGEHMAWIGSDPETGFPQVYLHDFRSGETLRVTSHPSEKENLVLHPSGSMTWEDRLFTTRTVFSFVP